MARFPLSVLTATALKQSIIQSLIWRFETEMQKYCSLCVSRVQAENTPPPSALSLSAQIKAYEAARDVLTDLRELLRVSIVGTFTPLHVCFLMETIAGLR